jgi:hypothetical protein
MITNQHLVKVSLCGSHPVERVLRTSLLVRNTRLAFGSDPSQIKVYRIFQLDLPLSPGRAFAIRGYYPKGIISGRILLLPAQSRVLKS